MTPAQQQERLSEILRDTRRRRDFMRGAYYGMVCGWICGGAFLTAILVQRL